MIVLAIRTDSPQAEIYLFDDKEQIAVLTWHAHRELAETLHIKIREVLDAANISLRELDKIAVYKGPGSFTGLRIGLSVANALSYALNIPTVAKTGENWLEEALIEKGEHYPVSPEYGAEPHITQQKK